MPDLEACSLLFFFGPRLCTVCQWWMDDFGLEMIDQHRPAISSLHLRSFLHVALWLRCRHLAKSIDTMHTTSISFCRRRALLGKGRVLRHVAPRDTEAEIARSVEIRGCPGRGLSIRFTGNHRFFFGGGHFSATFAITRGSIKFQWDTWWEHGIYIHCGHQTWPSPRHTTAISYRRDPNRWREYRWFIFIHVYASFHALVHHQPRFRTCSFFPLMAICHRLNFQDLWGTCFFLQTTSSTHRNLILTHLGISAKIHPKNGRAMPKLGLELCPTFIGYSIYVPMPVLIKKPAPLFQISCISR